MALNRGRMTTPRRGRVRRGQQGLLTILFTDLEGSTAMTQRLGDARAQEIVRAHNTIVRREVSARGGAEVKHTGDGIMATFNSAARAVSAAVAMQQASRTYNEAHPETAFNIAVGLNAGEPVAEDADVFGSAVQLAARTCAEANGGQILATNVVRELVYGKGALFADQGAAELKGFDEPVHLFEVSVGAGGIDEGGQDARNWLSPPLLAAIGAVVVVAVGAVVLVLVRSGGGEGDAGDPQYTEIHIRTTEARLEFDEISGDCVTTPLMLSARFEGSFTGDISGTVSSQFEIAGSLSDQCESLALSGITTTDVDGGSSIVGATRGFSLWGLSSESASASEQIHAAITTGGTGVYKGVAGRTVCRSSTLNRTQAPQDALASLECTIKLAPRASLPPVIFQPIANAEKVTTQLGPSSRGDTFKMLLLYFNTLDEPLSGLSVHLPIPAGARISSSAGEGDAMAEGAREWELPDLAPGEVASFEIAVRLLSAEEDSITLLPQIAMQGRKQTFKSDPVVVAVER